ncbi:MULTISPECIES: type II secretion system F family protein [Limnobacter]|uniref:Type II secretion system protein F n=1 Tax=Limnobacter litoralis TaxID=481366 RepID=A0ABQ5YUF7_9BURK|nr:MULTISPECIES: type II secretion system F family protein [Limnobacter]GLR26087.1 type II secretion system protein F [Limnobacter litoralis]HEX5487260.1 type II secretion system F family protein [Limnobacter sp.]
MNTATRSPSPGKGEKLFVWTEKRRSRGLAPRTGEIKAKSAEQARHLLKKQGIQLAALRQQRTHHSGKVKLPILAAFVRQLAVMTQSGVPLGQSLGLIAGNLQGRKKTEIRRIVREIRADIESGLRLSEAMRKHPNCFDNLFCNILSAGEDSGELDSVLMRLANYMEKAQRTRQRVKKAMLYPSIVIVVAIVVSISMLVFVLPTFETVFRQFGGKLPGLTQSLLDASHLLRDHGLVVAAAVAVAVYVFRQLYKKRPRFTDAVDAGLLKLPIFGELMRTAIYARWTRTFSTLSASGVPIVSALESVAGVANNKSYQLATIGIRQAVASGQRVSDSMEQSRVFPADAVQMIRIGEESGRLDQMLDRLATQYETRLDDIVDNLSTVMEPMIMCVIGSLVGTLIIGMYLPIFKIGGVV